MAGQNTNWIAIYNFIFQCYYFPEKRSKSQLKVDEDGIITEKDEEKKPRKPDDYYTQLLGPACETDLFKRTSELELMRRAAEDDKTKLTKATDPVNCTPTRRALLQIAVLKPGDLFVSKLGTVSREFVVRARKSCETRDVCAAYAPPPITVVVGSILEPNMHM